MHKLEVNPRTDYQMYGRHYTIFLAMRNWDCYRIDESTPRTLSVN